MPSVGSSNRSFASLLAELPLQHATTWPARQKPWALVAWGLATIAATIGIAIWVHPGLAALAFVVLAASAIPSVVPMHFTFQPQGILVEKGLWKRRILWTEIDRVEPSGAGLLLYANSDRGLGSQLDAFYLHCPGTAQKKLQLALESLRDARFRGSSLMQRAERSDVVASGVR